MFKLKQLSKDKVSGALEKAQCYRFLNEPWEAESICLDILDVEPENQQALVILILSLSDQFSGELSAEFSRARELLPRLSTRFHQVYYEGIISERRAKTHLNRGGHGSGRLAYEWLKKAMNLYEKAMSMDPQEEQEAILRWNACARLIMRTPGLQPPDETGETMLE